MSATPRSIAPLAVWCLFVAASGLTQPTHSAPGAPPLFTVHRATSPIIVDGHLDEAAWANALAIDVDIEVQPAENAPAPVKTVCLVAYDTRFLYVAFRAYDPHPENIRAHLSDRDTAYRDDFVGIMIDTFNDNRRGWEFFVNPLGVQMDLSRNEVGTGDNEDSTWDAIWDSAGRITSEGYVVEMAIPFSSIRFPSTTGPQTWAFAPFRAYPRIVRHQLFPVPLDRSNNCFLCQMPRIQGMQGIEPGKDIELDPTLTGQRSDVLRDEDNLQSGLVNGNLDAEAGLTARWGVTPNLSLAGALNPDFSQVEADAAQLAVNQRFTLFYPEKRPFFMEGADFFDTPFTAVYTRTVADPSWGAKVTGKSGPQALSAFVARDRVTNLIFPANQGSELASYDFANTAGVARYRRDVGRSSTVGVLATSREGGGYHNRVGGVDGLLRLSSTDTVAFQVLHSDTAYPDAIGREQGQPRGSFGGNALTLAYEHDARDWQWWGDYADKGRLFRADLGFVPRVDTRGGELGGQRTWWGNRSDWWSRISVGAETSRIEDHTGTLTDESSGVFMRGEGPWQSTLHINAERFKEFFDGVTYDGYRQEIFFNIRPTGDFTTSVEIAAGDAVDYDNSRPARKLRVTPGATINIGRHLYLQLDHDFERLSVRSGRLYTANLSQARIVYQFTVRTFVRAIVHYLDLRRDPSLYLSEVDAHERTAFTQLLLSYKINPQTVFFLGYSDNRAAQDGIAFTQTDRTVFLKIGYAWLM